MPLSEFPSTRPPPGKIWAENEPTSHTHPTTEIPLPTWNGLWSDKCRWGGRPSFQIFCHQFVQFWKFQKCPHNGVLSMFLFFPQNRLTFWSIGARKPDRTDKLARHRPFRRSIPPETARHSPRNGTNPSDTAPDLSPAALSPRRHKHLPPHPSIPN